jgi:hypothetical protein
MTGMPADAAAKPGLGTSIVQALSGQLQAAAVQSAGAMPVERAV